MNFAFASPPPLHDGFNPTSTQLKSYFNCAPLATSDQSFSLLNIDFSFIHDDQHQWLVPHVIRSLLSVLILFVLLKLHAGIRLIAHYS